MASALTPSPVILFWRLGTAGAVSVVVVAPNGANLAEYVFLSRTEAVSPIRTCVFECGKEIYFVIVSGTVSPKADTITFNDFFFANSSALTGKLTIILPLHSPPTGTV